MKAHARHMACRVKVSWIPATPGPLAGCLCAVPTLHNCFWQPDTRLFNCLLFNPPNSPVRQALFPHFIPETQTARGNLATVIQLVSSGDTRKGTSGFQEPGTHVLTPKSHGQVAGVFSMSSLSPSHSHTVSSVLFLEPEQLLSRDSALPARANAQQSESANCSLTTRGTGASSQIGRERGKKGLAVPRRMLLPGGETWPAPLPGPRPSLGQGFIVCPQESSELS